MKRVSKVAHQWDACYQSVVQIIISVDHASWTHQKSVTQPEMHWHHVWIIFSKTTILCECVKITSEWRKNICGVSHIAVAAARLLLALMGNKATIWHQMREWILVSLWAERCGRIHWSRHCWMPGWEGINCWRQQGTRCKRRCILQTNWSKRR